LRTPAFSTAAASSPQASRASARQHVHIHDDTDDGADTASHCAHHPLHLLANMAGTIRPNETNVSTEATLPFSSIPDLDPPMSAKKPPTPRTPRIDVEPLYSAVKGAISDTDWTTNTSALEHSHNTLVAAIYANIWRDAPEPGIASWVSSTDKPSSSTVKGQGDESEKRLKYEVMQLSRRERKRLKTIPAAEMNVAQDGMGGGAGVGALGPVNELIEMRRVKQPEIGPVGPAGGYKTSQYILLPTCLLFQPLYPIASYRKTPAKLTANRLGS
jgi:hypothetical protein